MPLNKETQLYIEAHKKIGKWLLQSNKYEKALEVFNELLEYIPQDEELCTMRKTCLSKLGRNVEASVFVPNNAAPSMHEDDGRSVQNIGESSKVSFE
jgi:Flp pilus assembly protein TadD